jgi:hypothetical protein
MQARLTCRKEMREGRVRVHFALRACWPLIQVLLEALHVDSPLAIQPMQIRRVVQLPNYGISID